MKPTVRRILTACLLPILVVAGLFTAAALWLWLWVPTHGKPWLEARLEQALPLDVSIGTLRYNPWRGITLEQVELRDRTDPSLVWLAAPRALARVDVLPLLFWRQVRLRLVGRLQIPCETDVTAVITASLSDGRLDASIATSDIRLQDIQPPVNRFLPPSVTEGRTRLALRLRTGPHQAVSIESRLPISQLVWGQQGLRFVGDVEAVGAVQVAPEREPAWAGQIDVELLAGELDGVPSVGPIRHLRGSARITPSGIQIASLTGQVEWAPWAVSGIIGLDADATAELYATSAVRLEDAVPRLWPDGAAWQLTGLADIKAVCRGPLARWPQVELQVIGAVRDAAAIVPSVPARAERISATVQYDHLTDTLTVAELSARVQDAAVSVRGTLHPLTPPQVHLEAHVSGDLARLQPWLPAEHPIRAMQGPFAATLRVEGPAAAPAIEGDATLDGARVQLRGWPTAIEALRGTVRATAERLDTERLSFVIAQQPVTVSAHLTQWRSTPEITLDAAFPNGTLTLAAVATPKELRIRTADAVVGASRLRLSGTVGREAEQPSSLQMRGRLDLHDLSTVPWLALKPLAAWDAQGQLEIQLALTGRLDDWAAASLQGGARSERLTLLGVPLESLAFDLEQRERRLTVRLTNATIAEGKLTGRIVLNRQETPTKFLVEADATQVNLGRLAETLPAWRQRRIDGTASTHLSLMGTLQDRAEWRGDGWLHADGERLGELPLFDRLFRGVFGALADRLGLTTLRNATLVKVTGQWQLSQQRIRTDDLQLHGDTGGAPVVVMFRGSVGLDKTLDFLVEPTLPDQLILEAPNTSTLSRALLRVVGGVERLRQTVGRHHLGGTIDKPEYRFQVNLDQVFNQVVPSALERLMDSLR